MNLAPLAAPVGGSGVLASSGASTTPMPAVPAPVSPTSQAATPAESALSTMLESAALRQDGLAPLLANLEVAAAASELSPAVQATIADFLAAQTPLGAGLTGAALRTAAQNSGVFFEAALAAGLLGLGDGAAASPDLKGLLLRLTSDLLDPAQTDGEAAARAPPAANRPQPPIAGGQTAGQPAARATLDPQAPPEVMNRVLREQAEAVLARVQLSQAASIPKPGEPVRWSFEAPIATPSGVGVAQFEISRDGGGGADGAAAPAWRARFSINAAPSGPIHAAVVLSGDRMRVTLMAPDDGARAALAAGQDELTQALADAEGGDITVRVLGGAPERPPPPPGQFVDRQS